MSMPDSLACQETLWRQEYVELLLAPIEFVIFILAYARVKRGLPFGWVSAGSLLTGLGAAAATFAIMLPLGFCCFSF